MFRNFDIILYIVGGGNEGSLVVFAYGTDYFDSNVENGFMRAKLVLKKPVVEAL